ncbi:MAG TPA: hypothetical protein VLN59_05670, partial [Burkholderiales bacterium]|nr:hypothetical protein [Burkholderiales bacterium]
YGITHGAIGSGADVEEVGYDPRFTADTDNPTMSSALGYPICIPRINPFANGVPTAGFAPGVDALCPLSNRPIAPDCKSFDPATGIPPFGAQPAGFCTTWVMDPPNAPAPIEPTTGLPVTCPGPGTSDGKRCPTDPTRMAPVVIGDIINFAGTLKADANGPYISAHTIHANLGIYTTPHTWPAYVSMEGMLVGTGGTAIGGLPQEATGKVSWEGFSTDPTELVDFYSLHQDPITGAVTEFYLGTQDPCCSPLGRFRTIANNNGAFGEPSRNYRAVSRNACQAPNATTALTQMCHMDPLAIPDLTAIQAAPRRTANDLIAGQYTLPNFEFIFAENLTFGAPLVPNNFQDLPFLYCGWGPLDGPGSGTTVVGQLDPAPWAAPMNDPIFRNTYNGCSSVKTVSGASTTTTPAPAPATITAATATPSTMRVGTRGTVTFSVSATDPNVPALAPMTYQWTAPPGILLLNPTAATTTATFTPLATGTLTFTVTVSNGVTPPATRSVTVTINSGTVTTPQISSFTANPTPALGGTKVTLSAVATDPSGSPVGFTFTQQGGPTVTLAPVTVTGTAPAAQTGTTTFNAPTGGATTLTFGVTVRNASGGTVSGTVKVNVITDTVAILAPTWDNRQLRGKLNITATSTANPPPPGMTMTATYFNNSLPANVPGSAALPITTPLGLVIDTAICPTAAPCWNVLQLGVIANTSVSPPVFVAPTSITVRSNLGGSATVSGGSIRIRQ